MRYYWLRFYGEIYLKPDSHKTQRHEGELKANGKSYFGASIHFSLMIEIKAPCRGRFRVFRSRLIRTDCGYSSSIILGSPENDIQEKSLSNLKQNTITCWLISIKRFWTDPKLLVCYCCCCCCCFFFFSKIHFIFQSYFPTRGRQARNFTTNVPKNSRSQIVFRTDIFRKLSLGAPDKGKGL